MHALTNIINFPQFQSFIEDKRKRHYTFIATSFFGITLTLHSFRKFKGSPFLATSEFLLGIGCLAMSIWLKTHQKTKTPSLPTVSTEDTLYKLGTGNGIVSSKQTHADLWKSLTENEQFALEKRIIDFDLQRLSQSMSYIKFRDRIGLEVLQKHKDDPSLVPTLRDAAMRLNFSDLVKNCTTEEVVFLEIPTEFYQQNLLQMQINQMGGSDFASLDSDGKNEIIFHLTADESIGYLNLRTKFGIDTLKETKKGTIKLLKDKLKSHILNQRELTFIKLKETYSIDLSFFIEPQELDTLESQLIITIAVFARHKQFTYLQWRNNFGIEGLKKHINELNKSASSLFLEIFFKMEFDELASNEYEQDRQLLGIDINSLQTAIQNVENIPLDTILQDPSSYKSLAGHPSIQKKVTRLIAEHNSFDTFLAIYKSRLPSLIHYHWIDCENPEVMYKINGMIAADPIGFILQETGYITEHSQINSRLHSLKLINLFRSFKRKYIEQLKRYKYNLNKENHYLSESANRDFHYSRLGRPSTDPANLSLITSNFKNHKKQSKITDHDWNTHKEFLAQLSKDFAAQLT